MQPIQAICPVCQQLDAVRKVSVIWSDGIASARGYKQASIAVSSLSKRLAPPDSRSRGTQGAGAIIFFLGVAVMIAGFASSALLGTALFIGFVMLIIGLIIMASSVRGNMTMNTTMMVSDENRARMLWQHLYYCTRDDVVFFPGIPYAVPPEGMGQLLNQQIAHELQAAKAQQHQLPNP